MYRHIFITFGNFHLICLGANSFFGYSRHCYQSYLDFHRCQKVRGEKYEPCNYFKRVYR